MIVPETIPKPMLGHHTLSNNEHTETTFYYTTSSRWNYDLSQIHCQSAHLSPTLANKNEHTQLIAKVGGQCSLSLTHPFLSLPN